MNPEDTNDDGLVDSLHPSVRWLLWLTDAGTTFVNGALESLTVSVTVGGANAAASEETSINGLGVKAAIGTLTVMAV